MSFSLEQFETLCYRREREPAMRALVELLSTLDRQYGAFGAELSVQPLRAVAAPQVEEHVLTRAAAALSCLMSDAELWISAQWQKPLLALHRWIGALFAATPLCNADHVMRALNAGAVASDLSQFQLATKDLLKFSLLYTQESEVSLDLDAIHQANPDLAVSLAMVLISSRFLGSPAAHAKREQILPWLTQRLAEVKDIDALPTEVLHDVYMHCSYADRADKHDVKRPINQLIQAKLKKLGFKDWAPSPSLPSPLAAAGTEKPVLLVVLEWFTKNHSIYRTHSRTIDAARERFHVIGIGYDDCSDELTRQVFDEFVVMERSLGLVDQLRLIQQTAMVRHAGICYMPSVGMFPLTMWLANLRVAPLQVMGLGHPATTHSDRMDMVVVEEDYVGDASCFSEELLQLPADGMPYKPSAAADGLRVIRQAPVRPDPVRIAMCATTMKLNPRFLKVCARIVQEAKVHTHFEFLIGQNQGLTRPAVERVVRQYLGDHVTVHPHQHYARYIDVIAGCDMFINPFPFGNTNGIIDTVSAGLVGVCMTGPEVHAHIDQGLFERLNFPAWLVASTTDAYVAAAIRLAECHQERQDLKRRLSGLARVQKLFEGRPGVMGALFLDKLQARQSCGQSREHAPAQLVRSQSGQPVGVALLD